MKRMMSKDSHMESHIWKNGTHFLADKAKTDFNKQNGFTLIELLVVIAIIALLVSILLPSLKTAKELAQSAVCMSHTRQYSLAVLTYTIDNDGYFPLYATGNGTLPEATWYNAIAPYIGLENISAGDSQTEIDRKSTLNRTFNMRKCPSGEAWIGVNYGGYPGSKAAPFLYGTSPWITSPEWDVRIENINDPATWFMMMDVTDLYVYSPQWGPFNFDYDGDGINDSNSGVMTWAPYNLAKPKVHMEGCNASFCDGHAERLKFETWENTDNGFWTD